MCRGGVRAMSAPRFPKKPAMLRRAFRMSLADFALLDAFADAVGISDAAYLRWLLQREAGSQAALPTRLKRKRARVASMPCATDPVLLLQIAKVGNFLCQIARDVKACHQTGSALDLMPLLVVLLNIQHNTEMLILSPAGPLAKESAK